MPSCLCSECLLTHMVVDNSLADFPREGCQHVRLELAVGQDVFDGPSADRQIVRDNPPMASPPEALRAHVGEANVCRSFTQLGKTALKVGSVGVIGVRSEGRVLPSDVR